MVIGVGRHRDLGSEQGARPIEIDLRLDFENAVIRPGNSPCDHECQDLPLQFRSIGKKYLLNNCYGQRPWR